MNGNKERPLEAWRETSRRQWGKFRNLNCPELHKTKPWAQPARPLTSALRRVMTLNISLFSQCVWLPSVSRCFFTALLWSGALRAEQSIARGEEGARRARRHNEAQTVFFFLNAVGSAAVLAAANSENYTFAEQKKLSSILSFHFTSCAPACWLN